MRHPWTITTGVDAKLCERSALTPWTLARVRRDLWTRYGSRSYLAKLNLADGGTCPRFALLNEATKAAMTVGERVKWLKYLGLSEEDLEEMCRCEYPISPYDIRRFSALFGIRVDFLLLGSVPEVDPMGTYIEVWPTAGFGP